MNQLINRTPHNVTILSPDGPIVLPPAGPALRCSVARPIVRHLATEHGNIPVSRPLFGEVVDAPDASEGVVFLVARVVAEAARRPDFAVPDDLVRDESGQVIGCRSISFIEATTP